MAEHYCNQHLTEWFKRGAMRGYAHPIVDANGENTGKWCNAPEQEAETTPSTVSKPPPRQTPPPKMEISGQATGMLTKEIGDMIRADKLEIVFGADNAALLAEWYRGQVSFITSLNVEGVSQ